MKNQQSDWRTKVPKELHNLGAKHWTALCQFAEEIIKDERESMKQKAIISLPKQTKIHTITLENGTVLDCTYNRGWDDCREQTLQALREI